MSCNNWFMGYLIWCKHCQVLICLDQSIQSCFTFELSTYSYYLEVSLSSVSIMKFPHLLSKAMLKNFDFYSTFTQIQSLFLCKLCISNNNTDDSTFGAGIKHSFGTFITSET